MGAKYVLSNVALAPVAVTPLQSPDADSQECKDFIASVPQKFMGLKRAEVAAPVPPGIAAWAKSSNENVVVRCGVDMPLQYTAFSETVDVDGQNWLQVKDMTPGSELTTWYATGFSPAVAVTTFDDSRPKGLNMDALQPKDQPRYKAPLSQLQAAATQKDICQRFAARLPQALAEGYTRRAADSLADAAPGTAVWSAPGREDVVVRCGVADAPGYAPGVQLQQINEVPWFQDTTLASGTTAGAWFALGREITIAAFLPQDVAQDALVQLSDILAEFPEA